MANSTNNKPSEESPSSSVDVTVDTAEADAKQTTKQQQKTVLANMTVICVSFFLSVTAFSGLTNLQSSMNFEGSVGHTALTIIFLAPIVSNLTVSASVIRKLGSKRSMAVFMLITCAFPVASFSASSETLFLGAAVTGLAAGLLWSAHGSYMTALGRHYAALGGHSPQSIIGRFFGIFFMCHRLSMTAGSLLSSLVFRRPAEVDHLPPDVVRSICGSSYCYEALEADHWFNRSVNLEADFYESGLNNGTGSELTSSIYRPSAMQVYCLYGIYMACALVSPVLVLKFLRPLDDTSTSPSIGESVDVVEKQKPKSMWSSLCATLRHLVHLKMLLLMPIMFLHGASFAFFTADFAVGFTSCTLGIDRIGFVTAVYGATSALTSISCGLLLKYTGRHTLFFFGAACCLTTLIGMWKWVASSDQPEVLYLFAAFWGVCTTVWTSQLISFVGFLYNDESAPTAFACYYTIFNGSVGSWFVIGRRLCLGSQLHVLMLALAVGMVGYLIVEVLVRKDNAKRKGADVTLKADHDHSAKESASSTTTDIGQVTRY